MKNNRGNIELLLVLCCLVGVVAFFCISLAFSAALRDPREDQLSQEHVRLMEEIRKEEECLRNLMRQIQDLEEKNREREKTIRSVQPPQLQVKQLEEELLALGVEREELMKRIELLRKQLALLPGKPDPRSRQAKERELNKLTKLLAELERKIGQKTEERAALLDEQGGSAAQEFERQRDALRGEIERISNGRRALAGQIKDLRVKIMMGGNTRYEKPMFVECRKDVYVFYPKGEAVGVAELEKREIFSERIFGHDIIVLFVRPDGFSSFGKAYSKVRKLSRAICYEPIETHQSLDFLEGQADEE